MRKEEIKNILKSLSAEDYCKNADLHIHSDFSDGKMTPYEIVSQAKLKGLKYVSIADHNTIEAYTDTNILSNDIVIPAVEFDCYHQGVLIHVLGYGIDIDNKELQDFYSKNRPGKTFNLYRLFALRNPKKVIEKIHNAGGVAVLAHPCCYWTFNLDKFVKSLIDMGLDGIEVYYRYKRLRKVVNFHSKERVNEIAEKHALIKTGGSDSHGMTLENL